MNDLNVINGIGYALPEIFLLVAALVVLLVDTFLRPHSRILTYMLTQAAVLACLFLVLSDFANTPILLLRETYFYDYLASLVKAFGLLLTSVSLVYARRYWENRQLWQGEFFALVLLVSLGMMIMVASQHLVVIYLGLELMSLALYALVALVRDDKRATEAAMKYFILGALASGLLLYGMSLLYGLTKTLSLHEMVEVLKTSGMGMDTLPLLLAVVFVVSGLAFKLGAVPFHMWLPDIYQGSPTAVTLLIATLPKLATFVVMVRILMVGLNDVTLAWSQLFIALGVLSVVFGNVVAIAQTNLKRMLAYSAIAHMGFILLAFSMQSMEGYSAALFYTIIYVMTAVGGFGVLILLGHSGMDAETLHDLKGLNQRSPWFAFIMMLLLFSMAGIPPLAGFYAKLTVVSAVLKADYIYLAVVMVLMSVVGAFYYLRAIKMMYFDEPEDSTPIRVDVEFGVVMSLNGAVIVVLGVVPSLLMTVCVRALDLKGVL